MVEGRSSEGAWRRACVVSDATIVGREGVATASMGRQCRQWVGKRHIVGEDGEVGRAREEGREEGRALQRMIYKPIVV